MLGTVIITLLACTTFVASQSSPQIASPIVSLQLTLHNQGTIEGVRQSIGDGSFFISYRGIPYAAPPVGDLRFKEPRPVVPWDGIRVGTTPPVCPQLNYESFLRNRPEIIGDEDCLYLNVYRPDLHELSRCKYPVMVFIHGGGFQLGDADSYGGTPLPLLKKDIVLVSIQYRLGTLGFMSTGDSILPGNLGLKDQAFALKWIQDNIHRFGGDPNEVTLFGESAGAASTHYNILSPYSKGLFQRAILQSGMSVSLWASRDDHRTRALSVAKSLDCPGTEDSQSVNSSRLLQCFMEKPAKDLAYLAWKDTIMGLPFYMVPRVDGDFVPDHPAKLLKEGRYTKVDLMSGVCRDEGYTFAILFLMNDTVRRQALDDFDNKGAMMLLMDHGDNANYLTRRLFYHFVGKIDVSRDSIVGLERILGDIIANMGHDEASILHARDAAFGKKVYRYELQHRATVSYADLFNFTSPYKDWIPHVDDLMYLFNDVPSGINLNHADDLFLRDIMVDMWTNFAKTGNPTPNYDLGFKWEPMHSPDDLRFLSLVPAPMMKEDNRAERRKFWRDIPLPTNKYLFPEKFESSSGKCCCCK